MKTLYRKLRVWLLRQRLAHITHEIDQIEQFRQQHQRHLDILLQHAANLRADIWYAENPRPAAGSTLRSLNTSGCVRGRA